MKREDINTAVPFGGQTILIPSDLSPKRDCSSKRVKSYAHRTYGSVFHSFFFVCIYILGVRCGCCES